MTEKNDKVNAKLEKFIRSIQNKTNEYNSIVEEEKSIIDEFDDFSDCYDIEFEFDDLYRAHKKDERETIEICNQIADTLRDCICKLEQFTQIKTKKILLKTKKILLKNEIHYLLEEYKKFANMHNIIPLCLFETRPTYTCLT